MEKLIVFHILNKFYQFMLLYVIKIIILPFLHKSYISSNESIFYKNTKSQYNTIYLI